MKRLESESESESNLDHVDQRRYPILDRNEFFDVYRKFRPETTREEFERQWAEFQRCKSERLEKMRTQ